MLTRHSSINSVNLKNRHKQMFIVFTFCNFSRKTNTIGDEYDL